MYESIDCQAIRARCRAVAACAVGAGRGWGLVFLPRGAQKSEIFRGGGVGTLPRGEFVFL